MRLKKTAKSQGKKFQVLVEQEATQLLVRTNNHHGGFRNGIGILILKSCFNIYFLLNFL
ncbi:hypothetical protein HanRHA438_Chr08g0340341 [Helianthus annuus]|nr:hypothetical protein HanHA89_Chr08g0289011 [Helianthus annuus]KAJ0721714.1 hypothetical protein HanOQP8_Chr08g0278511 [Helianthus annuus]KAJ0896959.1 hypothetical protein HanRHA438_Chr08g0340341 [Helianthus annuus]